MKKARFRVVRFYDPSYDKSMSSGNLLAVDPSLSCSGWAFFDVNSGRLRGVGKLKAPRPGIAMARRIAELQSQIDRLLSHLSLGVNDVLICEAQTTLKDPRAAFLVEQVRGIFETLARTRSSSVPGRINPRSVHFEILGLKGAQLKREFVKGAGQHAVRHLYRDQLKGLGFPMDPKELDRNQDIVDAILIGHLGLIRISGAKTAELSLDEYFDSIGSDGTRTSRRKFADKLKVE